MYRLNLKSVALPVLNRRTAVAKKNSWYMRSGIVPLAGNSA